MEDKMTTNGELMARNALEAIKIINNNTSIRLIKHTTEKYDTRIMYTVNAGYVGISPVGKQDGEQKISITRESGIKTIIYKLLHSPGFWHEQSRYDRDNSIVIDTKEGIKYFFGTISLSV